MFPRLHIITVRPAIAAALLARWLAGSAVGAYSYFLFFHSPFNNMNLSNTYKNAKLTFIAQVELSICCLTSALPQRYSALAAATCAKLLLALSQQSHQRIERWL